MFCLKFTTKWEILKKLLISTVLWNLHYLIKTANLFFSQSLLNTVYLILQSFMISAHWHLFNVDVMHANCFEPTSCTRIVSSWRHARELFRVDVVHANCLVSTSYIELLSVKVMHRKVISIIINFEVRTLRTSFIWEHYWKVDTHVHLPTCQFGSHARTPRRLLGSGGGAPPHWHKTNDGHKIQFSSYLQCGM